jgi:tripartite-type tricarboxylate transporter receptor subunit TctC
LIQQGKVAALAVSSGKRAPLLPNVPTTAEIGLPDAAYAFWNGSFVPAKTPHEIVTRLYDETQKAIADASVKARLEKLGIEPLPMSQPQFAAYFKADVMDTDKLAQKAGIQKQ